MQLLEEVFCGSPSFVHVLRGPTYIIEFANDTYARMGGGRKLIGCPLFEAVPELSSVCYQSLLAQVRTAGQPFIGWEIAVMLAHAPGGRRKPFSTWFICHWSTPRDPGCHR